MLLKIKNDILLSLDREIRSFELNLISANSCYYYSLVTKSQKSKSKSLLLKSISLNYAPIEAYKDIAGIFQILSTPSFNTFILKSLHFNLFR